MSTAITAPWRTRAKSYASTVKRTITALSTISATSVPRLTLTTLALSVEATRRRNTLPASPAKMATEITEGMRMTARRLTEVCKEHCAKCHIQPKHCKEERFLAILEDYYHRLSDFTNLLKCCIEYAADHNRKVFVPLAFRNWCKNAVRFAKDKELKRHEENKLKNGTEYQQADLARRKQHQSQSYEL